MMAVKLTGFLVDYKIYYKVRDILCLNEYFFLVFTLKTT